MSLLRAAIDSLMPPGTLWRPEDGNYLDALLDGIGDNLDVLRQFVQTLAFVRDPLRTTLLSDLEKEFGIIPDDTISEAVRRQRLLAVKTDGSSTGTYTWLQNQLQVAGFSVNVYENAPAVNPELFLQFTNDTIFGGDPFPVQFGDDTSREFVSPGGQLVVNGPIYHNQALVQYGCPTDPGYWPMIFFVGGTATRDTNGAITSLTWAQVPIIRKTEFIRYIIKYKPMFTWACVLVEYV